MIAHQRNDVVRHSKKTRRQFSPAVRAGDFRRRQTHGVECLTCVVETGCEKSLLRVFAKQRITAQGIMHRNVHNVACIKSQPANGAGQIPVTIWICKRGVSGRFNRRFGLCRRRRNIRLWDVKFRATIRAIDAHSGGIFVRLQFSTARWTKKTNLHIPNNFENYAPEVQAISTNDSRKLITHFSCFKSNRLLKIPEIETRQ